MSHNSYLKYALFMAMKAYEIDGRDRILQGLRVAQAAVTER